MFPPLPIAFSDTSDCKNDLIAIVLTMTHKHFPTVKNVENPQRKVTEGFILGDLDFVNWVKGTFLSERADEKEIPQLRKLEPKVLLETVVNAVCKATIGSDVKNQSSSSVQDYLPKFF